MHLFCHRNSPAKRMKALSCFTFSKADAEILKPVKEISRGFSVKNVKSIEPNPLPLGAATSDHKSKQLEPVDLKALEFALSECIPVSYETAKSKITPTYKLKTTFPENNIINNKSVNNQLKISQESLIKSTTNNNKYRWNEFNIQMLSKGLYKQIFGNNTAAATGPTEDQISQARQELNKHHLLSDKCNAAEEVDLKLPAIEGGNIEEHFRIIGERQSAPYRKLLESLTSSLPIPPQEWVKSAGWTRYNPDPEPVDYPPDDALVFDVEVCVSAGQMPTMATAASPTTWYSWVSPVLAQQGKPVVKQHYNTHDFIPLESTPSQRGFNHGMTRPRVVVGHNVSYDRARVKEQYWLNSTGLRFIDTMSMHVCVGGVTSSQRAVLKSNAEAIEGEEWRDFSSLNNLSDVHNLYCGEALDKESRNVFVTGEMEEVSSRFQELMSYCANDVVATHQVLQQLLPLFLNRFPHPVTLAGMLELGTAYLPVNENWTRYISDANQTYEDLDAEGRFHLARQADKACQLMHNKQYEQDMWMWDQDWSLQELKLKKKLSTKKCKEELMDLDNVEVDHGEDEAVKIKQKQNRKFLTPVPKNPTNLIEEEDVDEEMLELERKFRYLVETGQYLPARIPHLPGYPAWYRKLCPRKKTTDWSPGPCDVSLSMQVTPKLLRLTWESYPLHFIRGQGWGLLVPYRTESDQQMPIKTLVEKCPMAGAHEVDAAMGTLRNDVQESLAKREYGRRKPADTGIPDWYKGTGVWCNVDVGGCCWFLKLPHKDGGTHRVGNPLAKDFLNKFSENVLAGSDFGAEKVLTIGRQLSYWRNNKERVEKQLVSWLADRDLPRDLKGQTIGAIIPQVVVCGTLTRRAVEATWMTASNANNERVGSELRAMIQAPAGYNLVGADVDSQELWIASVIGDASHARAHGGTPFGWMTLSGKKGDNTDMHSVTAKAVGISRFHAKVINYARIYGAGQSFAERLLKQFNPSMSQTEAKSKAAKMFALTKGKRTYRLKEGYRENLPDRNYSMYEALKLRSQHGVGIDEMFERPKWVGGTESAMFNRLEEIASMPSPSTPFLNGRLSRSLEPAINSDDKFLPTRVNWVVQSGAVDFLHLMLVCMKWLEPNIRFCLSFHDEVRYLVPSDAKYRAALSLHATNLLARAFCASRLGLRDLPQSVAFFASVEVDTVLRKEANDDCVTPSNPHGLARGYAVPLGESLDVYQAIAKAGNCLQNKRNVSSNKT